MMVELKEDHVYESLNPTNDTVYTTTSMFRNVSVPFICIFGVVGNTMAFVTFRNNKLRQTSCNMYLTIRSVLDTLFLLTLLCVWFDSVGVSFYHIQGVCQTVVFMSYVTSFLSVWCVTATTYENYIRMCEPSKIRIFCTLHKAKRIMITLCIVALIPYHTSLWITGIQTINGKEMCMTNKKFMLIYIIMTCIDTSLTLVIPLIVIMILSIFIVNSLVQCYRRKMRLQKRNSVTGSNTFRASPQAKVTRLLFAVSMIFVILHTPIHIIKLKMSINIYILQQHSVSPTEVALKTAFENFYYLNFSTNCVVFFVCGVSFRKVFTRIFCKCCKRSIDTALVNAEQQTELSLLAETKRYTSLKQNSQRSNGMSLSGIQQNSTTPHVSST